MTLMQPVANWRVTSKIAQTSQVVSPSNGPCHFIGTRHNPSLRKIKTKGLFLHLSSWFSNGFVLEDFKFQLGKLSEAEKIFE